MNELINWLDELQIVLMCQDTFLEKIKVYRKMEKIRQIIKNDCTNITHLGTFKVRVGRMNYIKQMMKDKGIEVNEEFRIIDRTKKYYEWESGENEN